MAYEEVTSPILTDATGQDIVDKLEEIAQNLQPPTNIEASDVSYDNTQSGMTATDVQDAVTELKSNLTWKLVDQKIGSTLIQVPVDFEEVYVVCRFGDSGGLHSQVVAETIPKIHWNGGLAFTFGAGTMFAQVSLTNDYKITMNAFQVSGATYTTTSQITVYYR